MKIDGGSWMKVTWDEAYTDWTWKEVTSVDWTEGEHVIIIGYREDGALLDKIHIGSTIPTGMGEEDNYCNTSTGISEYNKEDGFSQKIWAENEYSVSINYDLKMPGNIQFFIYNSTGQLVYQESLGKIK